MAVLAAGDDEHQECQRVGYELRELVRHADRGDLQLDVDRLGERDANACSGRECGTPAGEDHHGERDVAAAAGQVRDEPADGEGQLGAARTCERATDQRGREPCAKWRDANGDQRVGSIASCAPSPRRRPPDTAVYSRGAADPMRRSEG